MPSFRRLGDPFGVFGRLHGFGSGNQQPGFHWDRRVTFEQGALISYPTGFDTFAGANLNVNAAAAMRGNYGFELGIPNVNNRWGNIDNIPEYTKITAAFLFDPNSIVMANADVFSAITFNGSGPVFTGATLSLGYLLATGYFLRLVGRLDSGANVFGAFINIADVAMQITMEWMASTAVGANNGYLRLFVNNVLVDNIAGIDNDTFNVNQIRFGATGIDPGTSGSVYFDNICYSNKIR